MEMMNDENDPAKSTGYRCGTCCARPGEQHATDCAETNIAHAAIIAADMLAELDPAKVPLAVPAAIGVLRTAINAGPAASRHAAVRPSKIAIPEGATLCYEARTTGAPGWLLYDYAGRLVRALPRYDVAIIEAVIAATAAAASAGQAAPALPDYKPGHWFEARTLDEMQAFYLSRLPAIREAAKEHGYAIGLHGSERRDFDLMAMQWREDASDKDTLAHAIAIAACGISRQGAYKWEQKPNGRFAVSMPVCWTDHANPDFDKPSVGHIDLSVIAAQPSAQLEAAARDVLSERRRQIEQEGRTLEDDDRHRNGEMAQAAACYAIKSAGLSAPAQFWPWSVHWFKGSDPRRCLVKAGALILADIERLDRAAAISALRSPASNSQEGGDRG